MVRLSLYQPVLRVLRVVLCVLVAALVVLGDLQAALIVAVFLGLSFAHLLRSDRRPAFSRTRVNRSFRFASHSYESPKVTERPGLGSVLC